MIEFGQTGGSMVLYKFMDKLCERGYEVFAITPNERVKWRPGFSKVVIERLNERRSLKTKSYYLGLKIINKSKLLEQIAKLALDFRFSPIKKIQRLTQKLIENWISSDITISTHCFTAYANYALMDKSIPIYHMQSYEELFFSEEIFQKAARLTYYLPLIQIANSCWLLDKIKEKTGSTPFLLNPGIDISIFYPRVNIDKKYNDLSEHIIFSYYSPAKLKDWDGAVEAMKIVFKKLGDKQVKWIVFGGMPPSTPEIPIKFIGKIFGDSLAEMYSKAHVVFMNSWYESFPLPPIEAMACGTAVVTTRLGTEDYAYDEKNSLVIPPRRPELLADAIIRLINQPSFASQLAKNGVETAQKFTWEKSIDHLEEILHQVGENNRKNRFVDGFV
ncbi:MAG: glycosyltransferase family 4 protein [Caldisericales bacterium]|nr:glycosyltransferase family 4 protein [Caldisericales bacterium]